MPLLPKLAAAPKSTFFNGLFVFAGDLVIAAFSVKFTRLSDEDGLSLFSLSRYLRVLLLVLV